MPSGGRANPGPYASEMSETEIVRFMKTFIKEFEEGRRRAEPFAEKSRTLEKVAKDSARELWAKAWNKGRTLGYRNGKDNGEANVNEAVRKLKHLFRICKEYADARGDTAWARQEGRRSKPDALLSKLMAEAETISALNVMDHIGEQER